MFTNAHSHTYTSSVTHIWDRANTVFNTVPYLYKTADNNGFEQDIYGVLFIIDSSNNVTRRIFLLYGLYKHSCVLFPLRVTNCSFSNL